MNIEEAKLKLKEYEIKKELDAERERKEFITCRNCSYTEKRKTRFLRSEYLYCLIKEKDVSNGGMLEEFNFHWIAEKCPCFENMHMIKENI